MTEQQREAMNAVVEAKYDNDSDSDGGDIMSSHHSEPNDMERRSRTNTAGMAIKREN
jgi:hypothetical protein